MSSMNPAPSAPGMGAFYLDDRGAKLLRSIYQRARKHKLGLTDVALYAALIARANSEQRAWIQVPIVVLAGELGVKPKTISRAFAKLATAGWLRRHQSIGGAGEHEVTRTELLALTTSRSTKASHHDSVVTQVASAPADAKERDLPIEKARAISEGLKKRVELAAIPVPSRRNQVAAEIAWSVLRCALSRLDSLEHGVNVALKKLRLGQWKTPRTMPSDFPTLLYRERAASPQATDHAISTPAQTTASTATTVTPFRPASRDVAARHFAQLASFFGQGTEMSSNKATVEGYPESLCCATREFARAAS